MKIYIKCGIIIYTVTNFFATKSIRYALQSMAERDNMKLTFTTTSGVNYTLLKDKMLGENTYLLKSDGEYSETIPIMGITVEFPNGNKKTVYRYSQKDTTGITDIAVADCVCEYLEENFGK